MNYKDFSSPVVDEIRAKGIHNGRRWLAGLDAAEDLRRLHFGQTFSHRNMRCCLLNKNLIPVGVAQGGFGSPEDPAMLYTLIAFPSGNSNYELIVYRYTQDKLFISRDGKLIGFVRGDFNQDLDSIRKWEFYCGEELSGTFDLNGGWYGKSNMPVSFADKQRELSLKIAAPQRYRNWQEKCFHRLSLGLWSPPFQPDPVLPGRTRFASRAESELYFSAFVFFRMLVCN